MTRLRLGGRARADLEAIWEYTARQWDIDQAEAYLRVIDQAMVLLRENPRLGRDAGDERAGYFKFPALSHVIYYRLQSGTLDVIRILHKNMDAGQHM